MRLEFGILKTRWKTLKSPPPGRPKLVGLGCGRTSGNQGRFVQRACQYGAERSTDLWNLAKKGLMLFGKLFGRNRGTVCFHQ